MSVGWQFETWNVKNTDPKIDLDRVQTMKLVFRDERGRLNGATNYKPRMPKKPVEEKGAVSVVGQRLRVVR